MIDIVKVPLHDKRTINTRLAPGVILDQMRHVWSSESGKQGEEYSVYDFESWENVSNRTIFIGGDHSITRLTLPKTSVKNLVVIDAHFDLYGSVNNRPFHGNWLKLLIENNVIDPSNITMYGIRAFDKQELEYADNKKIKYNLLNYVEPHDIPVGPIYLSIDIDAIDPAYAPGTWYMEPGGWSSRNLLDFVKAYRDNLVAMDIVEIDPERDINNMTSKLAAKIIKEFL